MEIYIDLMIDGMVRQDISGGVQLSSCSQLPVNAHSWRQQVLAAVLLPLPPVWDTAAKLLAPGSSMSWLGLLWTFWGELADGTSVCVLFTFL